MKRLIGCMMLIAAALPAVAADVTLGLRTNYVWPVDFRYVRVELVDATDATESWVTFHAGNEEIDYLQGTEIAEFENIDKKTDYYLVIQLLDESALPVAGRAWNFRATKRKSRKTFDIRRP